MKVTDFFLDKLWPRFFAKKRFHNFNEFLFQLSLRGLGVSNWKSSRLSGEEWLVAEFLRKRFQQRDKLVFMDVGAHFGESASSLRAEFPQARIVAFEPSPTAYEKAVQALQGMSIELLNCGLAEKSGSSLLFDYAAKEVGSQHATLIEDVFKLGKASRGSRSVEVEIDSLDEVCRRLAVEKVDFLKIDTEGAERRVLAGAARLLEERRVDVIQFEFNEMNVYARVFMQDFFEILKGYRLYRLIPGGLLRLWAENALQSNIFAFQNIVALREE